MLNDPISASLAAAVEDRIAEYSTALYAFEQFPGPGSKAAADTAWRALLRARGNLEYHVLQADKLAGRRL